MTDPPNPTDPPSEDGIRTARENHPALTFDDVVHQRTRLGILAVLAEAGQADFPYLRTVLGLSDGNLGRHLQILEGAGLITISKGYHRRRPRTWATITATGRRALGRELANMRALMKRLAPHTTSHNAQTPQQPGPLAPGRTSDTPSAPQVTSSHPTATAHE